MSLPLDQASSAAVVSSPLAPDFVSRADKLVDYELGGVALNDASQGLQVRQWRVFVQAGDVCVAPHPEGAPVTVLFSAAGVTELSLAFDQLMHPTVAFVQNDVVKLYWFDATVAQQVTTSYPGASSPMLCHDDKRSIQVTAGVSDVLFFYVDSGGLYYRQQRDRFGVARLLAALPPGSSVITGVGMGTNGRVQVYMSAPPALHRDLRNGKLYLSTDGAVSPVGEGSTLTGIWRSKVLQWDEQPSMGWARVEASGYPVTLVVQADTANKSVTVTSDAPFRLPSVRGRTWQIEVRGSALVQAVILAGSREELEGADADNLQV